MYLEKVGRFNDLSDELRQKLESRLESFGKKVRYRFDISRPNPHPDEKGKPVFPSRWTLDPKVFTLSDPHEKRERVQKIKYVGLVKSANEKGEPDNFHPVRLTEVMAGYVTLDLETEEGRYYAMYLELHPKNRNGLFPDKNKQQVFERIDEKAAADRQRSERTARTKALNAAEGMSEKAVKEFAAAMLWDEGEDMAILRDRIEGMAETTPQLFNDLVEGKSIEIQATIKRAMDKGVIAYDPAQNAFQWAANGALLATLQPNDVKNEVEMLSDWVQTAGDNAKKAYEKIKSLLK